MKHIPLEVHKTRRFDKQLQAMHKAGKNERDIARRAERIVNNLQADPLHEETECRRTHHGENRVKGCRKYDLSCGFRLVGLKRGKRLIFTYIGNHAECQQWIDNHRKKQEMIESAPIPKSRSEDRRKAVSPSSQEPITPEIDIYEEQLMAKIDEQTLCEIFSGLCKKSEK